MVQLSLALTQKISLSQMQRLMIQLMTLRGQDMRDFLQEQVVTNPLLDIRYPDVYQAKGQSQEKPLYQVKAHSGSWEEKLMKQLRLQQVPKAILMAGGLIIQHLDEKGFCTEDIDFLGQPYQLSVQQMAAGLSLVQSFDPPGIGAQSVQDCLRLQTIRSGKAPKGTLELVTTCYDDFLHARWETIAKTLDISLAEVGKIRAFLKTLSLQPIATMDERHEYIRPDVEIYVDKAGQVQIRSLEELPEVFFRHDLYAAYAAQGDGETKQFIRKAKRQFLDLQSALAYRWKSIFTVLSYVAARQEAHFREGKALRPLLQQDVAHATGLSTATVSRVCRDRYVLCKQRVVPLQSFFARSYSHHASVSGVISDKAIMAELTALIQAENKQKPLSDQAIMEHFKARNIAIARRTIAKFRTHLHIPNSTMRKRIHALQQA